MSSCKTLVVYFVMLCVVWLAVAERKVTNTNRSSNFPDPLVCIDGSKVLDAGTWRKKRRPEIMQLFQSQVYGLNPAKPPHEWFEVIKVDPHGLGGIARSKEITIHFKHGPKRTETLLILLVPKNESKPVPVFLGTDDWHWPKQVMLARGYAVAYIKNIRELEEDENPHGWESGIRGFYLTERQRTQFAADDWGAIGAWAWALGRAVDYLTTDKDIDAKRIAVMGHSRWGKAALWAAAQDERIALVISNDSGSGGAALARTMFENLKDGRTGIRDVDGSHAHWFCDNYKKYRGHEEDLPVDQHELIALIASRPVYVASAAEDEYTDPRSEFLSAKYAEPVYRLFGETGLGVNDIPPLNTPVGDFIGYHIRSGKHGLTDYDWEQFLRFADCHLRQQHQSCLSTASRN